MVTVSNDYTDDESINAATQTNPCLDIQRYRSLSIRVTAYVFSFIQNLRNSKDKRQIGFISVEERYKALKVLTGAVQQETFKDEIDSLNSSSQKKVPLKDDLNEDEDDDGLRNDYDDYTNDLTSNCGVGRICDRCDHFKHILVEDYFLKVCCKSCSEHFEVGYFKDGDKTQPACTCQYDKIKGDCWKGLACSACKDTGKINGVPVCCENCEKSGLRFGLGDKYPTCDCLHNGI
ncbi:unnamed protein product [Mytilus coruscus]|uniref:Uncharacterized protein n=1 Tax=Mytilus coruscus TaxID=42192 RepID=A0A6J8DWS1_MYTCO|nr:unnamed protein product [Mytilus coruscus]